MNERPLTWQKEDPAEPDTLKQPFDWRVLGVSLGLLGTLAVGAYIGYQMKDPEVRTQTKTVTETVTVTRDNPATVKKLAQVKADLKDAERRVRLVGDDMFTGWPKCELEDGSTQYACLWNDGTGDLVFNIDFGKHFFTFPRS